MTECFYLNPSKMIQYISVLDGGEIKMLWSVVYCINNSNTNVFINNITNQKKIRELGFNKSSTRMSSLLSSLVKKGILVKEGHGVYSIVEGLFIKSENK